MPGSWLIHHVYALQLLNSWGINFREQLLISSAPPAFLLGFFLSRPLLFLCGDALVYRMKLRSFMVLQPLTLLLLTRNSLDCCRWVAEHHPRASRAAFGGVVTFLRVAMGGPSMVRATVEDAAAEDAYDACVRVDTLVAVVGALLLPALVIWWLEEMMMSDFARCDPVALTWPGGPSAERVARAQAGVKERERGRRQRLGPPVGAGLMLTVLTWQLLEAVL